MLVFAGWLDATAASALHLQRLAPPGSHVIVGPWGHAGAARCVWILGLLNTRWRVYRLLFACLHVFIACALTAVCLFS